MQRLNGSATVVLDERIRKGVAQAVPIEDVLLVASLRKGSLRFFRGGKDAAEGMRQLDALMAVAARSRSVACTKMNAQSSRSHSVFMLHFTTAFSFVGF